MPSPRYKDVQLFVLALPDSDVKEIDEQGRPLMACRVIGKQDGMVIPGGVKVPYHSHYIARLKEGSLLPMDKATAVLAGVRFTPAVVSSNTKNK